MTQYRAIQVSNPGGMEMVTRTMPAPGKGEVLLRVEACGVCGADAFTVEAKNASSDNPRVPGHEVVGRIEVVGDNVSARWKVGMRVGVGRLGGHCGECKMCDKGWFNLCSNQHSVGSTQDGGYAEVMLARATGLVSIPEEYDSALAAPILCAGLATFNGLRHSGAGPGDLVAVHGVGGLGHIAIQYARKMGFRVLAIGRGEDISSLALELGAHRYVDTNNEDAAKVMLEYGGAQAILTTVGSGSAVSSLLPGLAAKGKLVVLGVGKEPIQLNSGWLVSGERQIVGSITGLPSDAEKALEFGLLVDAYPKIETYPFEQFQEAYQRMHSGDAEFRVVLTMNN